MSRTLLRYLMAGFEVTLNGRFWMTAEGMRTMLCGNGSGYKGNSIRNS